MEFPEDMISESLEREDLGDAADAVNFITFSLSDRRADYSPGHPNERTRQENYFRCLRKVQV
jgi:hypothetical protein